MEQFTICCSRGATSLSLFKSCILSNLLCVCVYLRLYCYCLVYVCLYFNVYRAPLKISIQLLSGSPVKKLQLKLRLPI